MCAKANDQPAEAAPANAEQQIQVYVAPDLEYTYRDFFSLYVGTEEVVIELGNRHRAQANRASIQNRVVLSIPNAFRLQQALARSLDEARKRIQEAQQKAAEANADDKGKGKKS